jgi:hypothetical protein
MAVQRIKALEHFALFAVPKAAICQDTVDIEDHQLEAREALTQGGWGAGEYE